MTYKSEWYMNPADNRVERRNYQEEEALYEEMHEKVNPQQDQAYQQYERRKQRQSAIDNVTILLSPTGAYISFSPEHREEIDSPRGFRNLGLTKIVIESANIRLPLI